ncbi:NADH dehydrogenase [ubiquinone] 1 beta subcomplex subunit 10 family protein [Opisthorchis viverrini]|uniref:NADH dehydrogenase [ubiquinone] 1 beta subcomplex subunit 10 n=1 Tax=Opisthorchis viverrini TaxID=6198 RepID=A0A1S8WG62_OPIVI|nr:NADH dehydrogenase [ubiquinone] 1 beta subcomplex subunit 10 family protein [Opisthorchis viverrini]
MGHGGGDDEHHDRIREDLNRPYQPSFVETHFMPFLYSIVDVPVTFFREHIVEKLRTPYPYYHQRFRRVPTIETCALDDLVCFHEANMQYERDRAVDRNILRILRRRRDECRAWYKFEEEDVQRFCKDITVDHEEAAVNFFIKYGELSWNTDVSHAFMKQKHRMLWERRNGPVGTGQRSAVDVARAVESADKTAEQEDSMLAVLRRITSRAGLPKELRP